MTHLVHLADPVQGLLDDLPAVKGNPFVFAGERQRPIDGSSHTKEQIEAELHRLGTPLEDWRFHDFRRAGVTTLARLGFGPHIPDKLLNHVSGTIHGVAAVYQRHEFLAERAAALDAWAGYVLASANVSSQAAKTRQLERALS